MELTLDELTDLIEYWVELNKDKSEFKDLSEGDLYKHVAGKILELSAYDYSNFGQSRYTCPWCGS